MSYPTGLSRARLGSVSSITINELERTIIKDSKKERIPMNLLLPHLKSVFQKTSWKEMTFGIVLMLMMIVGNAFQIIGVNFWLREFPGGTGGSYAIFAISGGFFGTIFVVWLVAHIMINRPDLRFVMCKNGIILLLGIGFVDTLNSGIAIYAANETPEVMQALFVALLPVYTSGLTKLILKDQRDYGNRYVVISFIFMIGGVLLASIPNFTQGKFSGNTIAWSALFFISVPFTALMNVWQSKYMENYTDPAQAALQGTHQNEANGRAREDEKKKKVKRDNRESDVKIIVTESDTEFDDRAGGNITPDEAERLPLISMPSHQYSLFSEIDKINKTSDSNTNISSNYSAPEERPQETLSSFNTVNTDTEAIRGYHKRFGPPIVIDGRVRGDDTTVKLVLLAGDTWSQFLMTLALMPCDAIPWYGGSSSVKQTWHNFTNDTTEMFTNSRNFFFGCVYSIGFVFTYIGGAYLNQYSPTLCCMIGQLSAPITAIILIIVPAWNLAPGNSPWYFDVIAIVMLTVGTILYFAWEEVSNMVVAEENYEQQHMGFFGRDGVIDEVDPETFSPPFRTPLLSNSNNQRF
eukprot:Tbor_TRINITY_DN5518_c0_g4::TRINITY_DN5518_c0_g4_i1::g.13148::m.13148